MGPVQAGYDFSSDKLQIDHKNSWAVLTGNVVIQNDTQQLNARRVKIYYRENGDTIRRIVARGKVRMVRDTWTARAQFAAYNVKADTLLLRGEAYFSRGKNEFWGERIVLDLKKRELKMVGKVHGILRENLVQKQS